MSLPNDVARCAGVWRWHQQPGVNGDAGLHGPPQLLSPCVECLRYTSPRGEFGPMMCTPNFADTCPYRIAPHD